MGTFLQLSGIIGSESRENSPFIRSSCAPQTHPHRRISPNPPQESFCGFFCFLEIFTSPLQFCAEFFTNGCYDRYRRRKCAGQTERTKMRGGLLQKGTAIAAATRKRGKTCMRLSFPPAGFFGTPAVFCVRGSPGRMSGGALREANGKTAGKPAVFVSEGDEQHRDGKGDDG